MSKRAAAPIVIRPGSADAARDALGKLVMAWARDIETGEPRYILELDEHQRGAKCGCECPSCAQPLTAVNAARSKFIKRPHFRHPEGAQGNDCSILAARAAALKLLTEDGVLELPRRRMSGIVAGLSGELHTAWVELPSKKIRITEVNFYDRAAAVLTLDDGRTLRVVLTGTVAQSSAKSDSVSAHAVPTIVLDIDDGAIAAMEPEEIRRRLQLLPDAICWRAHWDDAALQARAIDRAREIADDLLDWLPDDGSVPEGLSPELKRETLLHLEVKRIVEEAREIMVPGLSVFEELPTAGQPTLQRGWSIGDHLLELNNPRLEHRMERIIPDLVCEAWTEGGKLLDPFLVEVTVTNPIDEERLGRIKATGHTALEIDLSLAGGLVTRSELRRLVLEEVAVKRWLNYPEIEAVREELQAQMRQENDKRIQAEEAARERHRRIMQTPIEEIGAVYLSAVEQMLLEQENDAPPRSSSSGRSAVEEVANCVEQLTLRGYPEAGDEALLGYHRILARLLSIQKDRGRGYRYDSAMGVLNAVRQSTGHNRHEWTLYLIAAKVYAPMLNEDQQRWLDGWRTEVSDAIVRDDPGYMRYADYDRILSLLFPEMAQRLANPKGKLPPPTEVKGNDRRQMFERPHSPPERRRSPFLTNKPRSNGGVAASESQDRRDWYLSGVELEAWKQAYPEAAATWAPTLKRLGIK